ncbi:MAG: helix-turn-helix domain-containing protein [Candidatus Aenigmatarchaeota archaeon]
MNNIFIDEYQYDSDIMTIIDVTKDDLSRKIAGEIVLSETPGKTIKKWREIFRIPQNVLAKEISVMPSVISDYENGRRKSPGIKIIRKIVAAMLSIDEKNGGNVLKNFFDYRESSVHEAIIDIKEFVEPVEIKKILKVINGEVLINPVSTKVYGYTIVDSIKAIVNLTPDELKRIYGMSTERVLIFTNVSTGRSPLIAIKVTSLKPALVVLHGINIKKVDELAQRIAKVENIGIATTETDIKEIMKNLRAVG